jgi:hypothetical protein
MLAERGIKNPYDSFEGRLAPFMRARSRLTEDGSISFYSTSAEEVAQRGRAAKVQMKERGSLMRSPGLWEPVSNGVVSVVFPVS